MVTWLVRVSRSYLHRGERRGYCDLNRKAELDRSGPIKCFFCKLHLVYCSQRTLSQRTYVTQPDEISQHSKCSTRIQKKEMTMSAKSGHTDKFEQRAFHGLVAILVKVVGKLAQFGVGLAEANVVAVLSVVHSDHHNRVGQVDDDALRGQAVFLAAPLQRGCSVLIVQHVARESVPTAEDR